MRSKHLVVAGAFAVGTFLGVSRPLEAQDPKSQVVQPQTLEGMEWNFRNLRPSGQPIVPVFDGWIPLEDGTADLCFGYFSMNLDEARDIPLGPDNFIEPARFDGRQPTHFRPVPAGDRRYYCSFTVNVPMDGEPVIWTLRHRGQEYAVPGYTWSPEYVLEDRSQPSREYVAPLLRFIEPAGPEGRGRRGGGITAGPVTAVVGSPLTLTLSVTLPEDEPYDGDPKRFRVLWHKFQGPPGEVAFGEPAARLEEGATTATTTATFSEPGDYVLLVQAVDGNSAFAGQCCWSTGYLNVTVSR